MYPHIFHLIPWTTKGFFNQIRLREDTHKKKCFFSGRTTKVRVTPPPIELSGSWCVGHFFTLVVRSLKKKFYVRLPLGMASTKLNFLENMSPKLWPLILGVTIQKFFFNTKKVFQGLLSMFKFCPKKVYSIERVYTPSNFYLKSSVPMLYPFFT